MYFVSLKRDWYKIKKRRNAVEGDDRKMFVVISALLAMSAVAVLLSDKKVKFLEVIEFVGGVTAASALLVGVNAVCGFKLTDFFAISGLVLMIAAIRYGRGMRFRRITVRKENRAQKNDNTDFHLY